ncbi:MAG: penicillin-binding protein, partial [Deltaproteobacteria bacterium]|nr:penicillin-binding protein [Deltaproteobacteria bacterium]
MRQGVALFAAVALVAAALPLVRKHDEKLTSLLSKARLVVANSQKPKGPAGDVDPPALTDVDLTNIDSRRAVVTAPAHGKRTAELTL